MQKLLVSLVSRGIPVVAVVVIVSAFQNASAATTRTEKRTSEEPLWEIALGGYGRYGPAYPASEDSQADVIPLPFPIYRGKFLRVGDEQDKPVRTRIFKRDRIKLDLDFGLNLPVDSDDVDAREGLPDLDLLVEAGPELQLQFEENLPGDFFLALQTRGAWSFDGLSSSWRGMIFTTEFKYEIPLGKSSYSLRVQPEYATRDYMDFFYGVDAKFATPDRPEFEAESGYLGTKLIFSYGHEISRKFEIRTGLRLGYYKGAKNEDSPLFTTNSTEEVYAAFLWKFWESKRRAMEP